MVECVLYLTWKYNICQLVNNNGESATCVRLCNYHSFDN
jgi:hypothetical protein